MGQIPQSTTKDTRKHTALNQPAFLKQWNFPLSRFQFWVTRCHVDVQSIYPFQNVPNKAPRPHGACCARTPQRMRCRARPVDVEIPDLGAWAAKSLGILAHHFPATLAIAIRWAVLILQYLLYCIDCVVFKKPIMFLSSYSSLSYCLWFQIAFGGFQRSDLL